MNFVADLARNKTTKVSGAATKAGIETKRFLLRRVSDD